jgi:integrase
LDNYIFEILLSSSSNDKRLLADFLLDCMQQHNIKLKSKKSYVLSLTELLAHFNYKKSFDQLTSQDVAAFLKKFSYVKLPDGKPGPFRDHNIDPDQKWINTHNVNASAISKFYRWKHRPDLGNKARRKLRGEELPDVLRELPDLWIEKKGPKSPVKPEDLWDAEDDVIFFKYCKHNPRLRFYHALAIDTLARPCELLPLKIKDIKIDRSNEGKFYVRLRVGLYGKVEESRPVPMHNSIKYYRAWLPHHPEGGSPGDEAFVFASKERSAIGKASVPISEPALYKDYYFYKDKIIPRLLKRPDIPKEDMAHLEYLVRRKKRNPYNMRHTGVTRMGRTPNVKESDLIKIGGWKSAKMLREIYRHLTQDDVFDDVMLTFGIDTRGDKKQRQQIADEQLRDVFCWHCGMENVRDVQFCSECKWVLTDKEDAKLNQEAERSREENERLKKRVVELEMQYDKHIGGLRAELNAHIEKTDRNCSELIAGLKAKNRKAHDKWKQHQIL